MIKNELNFDNLLNLEGQILSKGKWLTILTINNNERYEVLNSILEESKDTEDFCERVLACEDVKNTQLYSEISKYYKDDKHWYRVREILGDVFKTESDAGGLKVGNDNFSIVIPNGEGDGVTRVRIFNREESESINYDMMEYFITLNGEFNIYSYDCGNSVLKTLNGKYQAFYYGGMISLVEI